MVSQKLERACSYNLISIGAVALQSFTFSAISVPLLITDLGCVGNETSILDCSFNQSPDTSCGAFEEAGVVCQCESPL